MVKQLVATSSTAEDYSAAREFIYLENSNVAARPPPRFLDRLSDMEQRMVAVEGARMRLRRGELLFRQGTAHDGIYLIRKGRIRTFFVSPAGREITLAYWVPHHFVGGPEIFGGGAHLWSGIALSDAEVLHLAAAQLPKLIRELPGFALALIEALVYKGRCFSSLVQMLGTQTASGRLAHVLLSLSQIYGRTVTGPHGVPEVVISQTFTHEQIASMIGVTRQWVSMTLSKFRSESIVRTEGRRIVVMNTPVLTARSYN
jgi:CRP/FNR family transcriptional regulator, cyclic AMP receptor protein